MGFRAAKTAVDLSDFDDAALFGLLDAVIDRLFDTPVDRHGPRITELHRAVARVEALYTAEVGAFDGSLEYQIDARRSAAAWITTTTRCANADATRLVHRARQLTELPTIAPLYGAGMIDTTKVDLTCRARKRANAPERFAALEARFARTAVHETAERLASELAQLVDVVETERHDPTRGDHHDWESGNELHHAALLDGVGVLNATFEPDSYTVVDRAIANATERARVANDPPSFPQQRGDALAHICNAYLHGQTGGNHRPHVLVHTDLPTLQGTAIGLCEADTGRRLPARALARIACDALISRVLHADSVVLDHGRAVRNFTPAQYRALTAQYPTCVFPGCAIASCECDMHHGDWFERGGPTDLINGFPTCFTHHQFIHHGSWTVQKHLDRQVHWYRPDGTLYDTSHPRRYPEPIRLHTNQPESATTPPPEPRWPPEWTIRTITAEQRDRCRARTQTTQARAHITYRDRNTAHVHSNTGRYVIEFDTS